MEFGYYEFNVAGHYASAMINGDASGLSDEDEVQLADLFERSIPADRRARGHWDGFSEEDYTGFSRDDVSGLLADCYKVRWYFPVS